MQTINIKISKHEDLNKVMLISFTVTYIFMPKSKYFKLFFTCFPEGRAQFYKVDKPRDNKTYSSMDLGFSNWFSDYPM